jgi:hypothetical protein
MYTAGKPDLLKGLFLKFVSKPTKALLSKTSILFAPLDDLADDLFEVLAPKLSAKIRDDEVNADVAEFEEGVILRNEQKSLGLKPIPPSGKSEEFYQGYEWGRYNQMPLPAHTKRNVIETALMKHSQKVSERIIVKALRSAWDLINPVNIIKHIFHAIKKYGWDADAHRVWYQKWPLRVLKIVLIAVVYCLIEYFEHAVIPKALVMITGNSAYYAVGALPLFEMFAPLVYLFFRKAGQEVTEETETPLAWYQKQFGNLPTLPKDNLFQPTALNTP